MNDVTQRKNECAKVIARFIKLPVDKEDAFFSKCVVEELESKKIQIRTPVSTNTVDAMVRGLGQEEFYQSKIKSTVARVLDGYNASILCYGYSGSGKTYTVFGEFGNEGIVHRSVGDFLSDHRSRSLRIKMIEVYMDTATDMLAPGNPPVYSGTNGVFGVTSIAVESQEAARLIFDRVERQTKRNNVHEKSSRSHCVTILEVKTESTIAEMYIVDLAGCERYFSEDNERFSGPGSASMERETKTINRSVFAINKVVKACADNNPYIPYRDSKITMILKQAIGGNSSTLIVLCCNSAKLNETVFTLRFGQRCQRVNNVIVRGVVKETGFSTRAKEYGEMEALVTELQNTIGYLTEKIKEMEIQTPRTDVMRFNGTKPDTMQSLNDTFETGENLKWGDIFSSGGESLRETVDLCRYIFPTIPPEEKYSIDNPFLPTATQIPSEKVVVAPNTFIKTSNDLASNEKDVHVFVPPVVAETAETGDSVSNEAPVRPKINVKICC
jgi:Kinesin motor domain